MIEPTDYEIEVLMQSLGFRNVSRRQALQIYALSQRTLIGDRDAERELEQLHEVFAR